MLERHRESHAICVIVCDQVNILRIVYETQLRNLVIKQKIYKLFGYNYKCTQRFPYILNQSKEIDLYIIDLPKII